MSIAYQEKARLRDENKPKPEKPLLLQLKEKADHLVDLVPVKFRPLFQDPSLHLVFVDTENNSLQWTLDYCRELSFYSDKLNKWLFFDVDMDGDHKVQMEVCFNRLQEMFPEPVVFIHYNYTELKLLTELFSRFEFAPSHSYCDLLPLVRALVDNKNPDSNRLYSPMRNLSIILKYWYEGTDSKYNIPRQLEIKATTGRKSELDGKLLCIQN